jgi:hypothetical protein
LAKKRIRLSIQAPLAFDFSSPIERSFHRPQEATIGLMQTNLELCFFIGCGLVNRVTMPASCCWNRTFTVGVLAG